MTKSKFLILVLLLAVAAAAGINYGRGRPILSNPFGAKTWDEKMHHVREIFR